MTIFDSPVVMNWMPIDATSRPRMRVAMLSPTSPKTCFSQRPDMKIKEFMSETPAQTGINPINRRSCPAASALLA